MQYPEREKALLTEITTHLPQLKAVLDTVSKEWVYEDYLYRFYHHSFKVFYLQDHTNTIVMALRTLSPEPLDPKFEAIVADGTGHQFSLDVNRRWLEATRPIVEAFLHAKYFLEMVVKYAPSEDHHSFLPSGFAAVLTLYGLRD